MADLEDREAELSKKDRLVNAWLAAGPEAMAKSIAEITDSSIAYASRIKSQMEEGELGEDEVETVRDEALVDEYANRLDQLAGEGEETTTEETGPATEPEAEAEPTQASEGNQGATATEPAEAAAEREGEAETDADPSEQHRPSAQEVQQDQQERHQGGAQQQSQGVSQPQGTRQPQQPQHAQQRQPQQVFSAAERESVSVEQLRELDQLLATYEEEAQFTVQHLPQQQAAEAVGKLFVAQKTRSLLREIIEGDEEAGTE